MAGMRARSKSGRAVRKGERRLESLGLEALGDRSREMNERVQRGDVPAGLTVEQFTRRVPHWLDGLAPTTRDSYSKFVLYFWEWWRGLRSEGGSELPVSFLSTNHVITYLEENLWGVLAARGEPLSMSWMYITLAGLERWCRFSGYGHLVEWWVVKNWLLAWKKEYPRAPTAARGLTWQLITRVMESAWEAKPWEGPEQALRRASFDVALIRTMWGCLLRRSEAAQMRWGDITIESHGGHVYGVLNIPFGKTDPTGRGDVGYLHLNTLAALQDMARACGRDPSRSDQPVFGIGGRQISNRIGSACEKAGLGSEGWSGHSPRVGAAMDLMRYGFTVLETMQAGRWDRVETVERYVRGIAAGDGAMARLQARGEGSGKKVLMPAWVGRRGL